MAEQDNIIQFPGPQSQDLEDPDSGGAIATDPPEHPPRQAQGESTVPGRLVWLHCPTCGSYEYTELVLPGGRAHNRCGTTVEEAEVDLDLRAEYTLATVNINQLRALQDVIATQEKRFQEYRNRLTLAARQPLKAYPEPKPGSAQLPATQVDPLGLLISPFLQDPQNRFDSAGGSPGEDFPKAPEE